MVVNDAGGLHQSKALVLSNQDQPLYPTLFVFTVWPSRCLLRLDSFDMYAFSLSYFDAQNCNAKYNDPFFITGCRD